MDILKVYLEDSRAEFWDKMIIWTLFNVKLSKVEYFFKADVSQGLVTASIELLLFEITLSQAINLMQLIFIYPNLCMDLMNSDGVFLICAACYKFCREFSLYKFHDILFVYHIQILLSIFTSVFFNFYLNKISLKPYKFQYCYVYIPHLQRHYLDYDFEADSF